MPLKNISQKQFVITISGITSTYWTMASGGKTNRDKILIADGQRGINYNIPGFLTLEPITLQKPFEPVEDKTLVEWVKGQMSEPTEFNLSLQPVKADLSGTEFASAATIQYPKCYLFDYKFPDADRTAANVAMFELTIEPVEPPTYT